MRAFWRELLEAPPFAVVVLGVFVAVGAMWMLAAALYRVRDDRPASETTWRVVRLVGALGAVLACAGALAYLQAAGRAHRSDPLLAGRAVLGDVTGRVVFGALVAVCAPCAALLATRGRSLDLRFAALLVVLPLSLAGGAVAQDGLAERAACRSAELRDAVRAAPALAFVDGLGALGTAASVVPLASVLCAALALGLARKARVSSRDLGVAAFVLAGGAAAYAGTRDLAADARHPIPYDEARVFDLGWAPPPRRTRAVTTCAPYGVAPELSFRGPRPTLDGRDVDAAALAHELETLKWIWSALHPSIPCPALLHVSRGEGERALPLARALAIARAAGITDFDEPVYDETPFVTKTRGTVRLRRVCVQPLAE